MQSDSYSAFKKSPYKSIKHSTYFKSYDHFFSSFKDKEITFVEIGVLGGGSLFMWREFFGKKAKIIGIDLNPNAKKWEKNGFEIYIGSQSDEKFWDDIKNKIKGIDILLDDGGHTYDQQIITVEKLLDVMNDGGLIVVEDTHTSYMSGFGPKRFSFINYVKQKIDQINFRFSDFSKTRKNETRIWSIEVVESMVAFKINKIGATEVSKVVENDGINDHAEDFRYKDNRLTIFFKEFAKYLKPLKSIPILASFHNLIANVVASLLSIANFKSKKYFK